MQTIALVAFAVVIVALCVGEWWSRTHKRCEDCGEIINPGTESTLARECGVNIHTTCYYERKEHGHIGTD